VLLSFPPVYMLIIQQKYCIHTNERLDLPCDR
jgi:hypothetical protein